MTSLVAHLIDISEAPYISDISSLSRNIIEKVFSMPKNAVLAGKILQTRNVRVVPPLQENPSACAHHQGISTLTVIMRALSTSGGRRSLGQTTSPFCHVLIRFPLSPWTNTILRAVSQSLRFPDGWLWRSDEATHTQQNHLLDRGIVACTLMQNFHPILIIHSEKCCLTGAMSSAAPASCIEPEAQLCNGQRDNA